MLRKILAAAAAAALCSMLLAASPAAASTGSGSATGSGSVFLVFHNQEGVTAPSSNPGPTLPASGPSSTGTGPRIVLSDDVLNGTFALNYFITHRGVAEFDRFKVRNTGDVTINLVYTSENEFNLPTTAVDDSQLEVCFLQGCDFGFWVPDNAVAPPVTLLQLAPGQEAEVTVGLRLRTDADWTMWNNRLRFSILHFQAQV